MYKNIKKKKSIRLIAYALYLYTYMIYIIEV